MVCLFVNGESITFLVDNGAAMSVINSNFMSKSPMSNESVTTLGASGVHMKELLTMPLPVEVDNTCINHQFIFSTCCPVNLSGRDLLSKLGINIICKGKGLTLYSLRRHVISQCCPTRSQHVIGTMHGMYRILMGH